MYKNIPIETKKISRKQLITFYLKIRKKRIIYSTISFLIFFIVITSFFLIRDNHKTQTFEKYANNLTNWNQDLQVSALNDQITGIWKSNYSSDYLIYTINTLKQTINGIIPNIVNSSYTALMGIQLYDGLYNPLYNIGSMINAFNPNLEFILSSTLTSGRMPSNFSEILYYRGFNDDNNYYINDTLSLNAIRLDYPSKQIKQYTIVGIIDQLANNLTSNHLSSDVIKQFDNLDSLFFTTYDFLIQLINDYYEIQTLILTEIDFEYDFESINTRNTLDNIVNIEQIGEIMSIYYNYTYNDISFLMNRDYYVYKDLLSMLKTFDDYWSQETVELIVFSFPVLFVLVIITFEIFNLGKYELIRTMKLFKEFGMKNKRIKRMLLLENSIVIFMSLIISLLMGILFCVFISIGSSSSITFLLKGLLTLQTIYSLSLFAVFLFIGNFLLQTTQLKQIKPIKSDESIKKRKIEIRKIFGIIEFLLLFPSTIMLVIGITGLIMLESGGFIVSWTYKIHQLNVIIFWGMTYIGMLLFCLIVFLSLNRLHTWFWNFVGNKSWIKKKNFLTFNLKNLTHFSHSYQRLNLCLFIVGISVLPNLIMSQTLQQHQELEANLNLGCTDLLIPSNDLNKTEIEQLRLIEGVQSLALLTKTTFHFVHYYEPVFPYTKKVTILAIHNITEYLDTVYLTRIGNLKQENILSLENNYTYMIDSYTADKYGYSNNVILKNTDFTHVHYQEFNLTYVSKFDYFPLLALPDNSYFSEDDEQFNLVTNIHTCNSIKYASSDTPQEEMEYVMIKALNSSMISTIVTIIKSNYHTNILTNESFSSNVNYLTIKLKDRFLILELIIVFILMGLLGFIVSLNIYQYKAKLIIINYQKGLTRKQIWKSLTFELLLSCIVPVIFGTIFSVVYTIFIPKFLITQQQIFKKIAIWLPSWIVILVPLIILSSVLMGWIPCVIFKTKRFKITKQE